MVGDSEAELLQALALPGLRARLIDLEHPYPIGEGGVSLGEGVEAGAEEDVLAHALVDEHSVRRGLTGGSAVDVNGGQWMG